MAGWVNHERPHQSSIQDKVVLDSTVQDRNGVVIRGRLPSGASARRGCAPLASLAAFVAPLGGPPRSNGLPPEVPGSYLTRAPAL